MGSLPFLKIREGLVINTWNVTSVEQFPSCVIIMFVGDHEDEERVPHVRLRDPAEMKAVMEWFHDAGEQLRIPGQDTPSEEAPGDQGHVFRALLRP